MLAIDDREPQGLRLSLLAACKESSIDARVGHMTYGDFVLDWPTDAGDKFVGIERKTVSDFLGSFASGRIQKQLDGLKATYDKAVLLIEGEMDYRTVEGRMRMHVGDRQTDWSFLSIQNYLFSVQMSGVLVIRTRSELETVLQVAGLHQYLARHQENVTVLPVAPRDKTLRHDVGCLTMIPGVGPKTATALVTQFHSIAGIILASDQELKTIKGVGELTLRNLRLVLGTAAPGGHAGNGKKEKTVAS